VYENKNKELTQSINLLENKLSEKVLELDELNKIKPIDY